MAVRYYPGFHFHGGIEAQEILNGNATLSDIQPGTIIEAIESDRIFDDLVRSIGRLTLLDTGMTEEEMSLAVAKMYEPVTRKPTIEGRFLLAKSGVPRLPNARSLIIVPPYKPPVGDDIGYVRHRTISAWAVKRTNTKRSSQPSVYGLSCTIYQPARSIDRPYLLKTLGGLEAMLSNHELLSRLQSNRKLLA